MLSYATEIAPWVILVILLTVAFETVLRKFWKSPSPGKPEPEVFVHPTRLSACREITNAIVVHLRQLEDYEFPNFAGRSGKSTTLCRMAVGWDNKFGIGEATCSVCIKEALRRYPDEELMLRDDI